MRDILTLGKWFKGLETAPEEDLKEIGFRIVKLIMEKENEIDTSKDIYPMSKVWADIQKDALGTYNAYTERKKFGEEHGKKMDPVSVLVWQYCQKHPKANAAEVGEFLKSKGIDKSSEAQKSQWSKIYDLDGWKNRKDSEWGKGFSSKNSVGIPIENSENLSENIDISLIQKLDF